MTCDCCGKTEVAMEDRSTADQLAFLHASIRVLTESLLEVMRRATDADDVVKIIEERVRPIARKERR